VSVVGVRIGIACQRSLMGGGGGVEYVLLSTMTPCLGIPHPYLSL